MALAFHIEYGNLVLGVMKGTRGWLDRIETDAALSRLAANGAASLTYISAASATDITDGTITTNGISSTTVNGTYYDKEVTLSLKPSQAGSFYTQPDGLSKVIQRSADAFYQAQQNAAVAALKAGTATTNCSITLTTGQGDFATDGTADEAHDNLVNLGKLVANFSANFANMDPTSFALVGPPTVMANIIALAQTNVQTAQYFTRNNGVPGSYLGYSYMGIPFFVVTGATNFGSDGNECLFITHRESLLFYRAMPALHGGGVIASPDGTFKWITTGPFALAINGSHFGEIVNPAS